MRFLKILLVLGLLCTVMPALAKDEEQKPEYDLSGTWKVFLSNSLTRRQVTFSLENQDGRYRGFLLAKGYSELRLTGRVQDDNKIFFWGRHVDRTGRSYEYEFRGKVEGEPGQEKLVGQSEFFGKRYDFEGTRGEH